MPISCPTFIWPATRCDWINFLATFSFMVRPFLRQGNLTPRGKRANTGRRFLAEDMFVESPQGGTPTGHAHRRVPYRGTMNTLPVTKPSFDTSLCRFTLVARANAMETNADILVIGGGFGGLSCFRSIDRARRK